MRSNWDTLRIESGDRTPSVWYEAANEYYKHIGGKFVKIRTFKLPNQELPENVYYYDSI